MKNKIFKTSKLPFLELRFIDKVTSCNKKHNHDELTITAIKTGNINIVFNDKSDLLKPNKLSIINPNKVLPYDLFTEIIKSESLEQDTWREGKKIYENNS